MVMTLFILKIDNHRQLFKI